MGAVMVALSAICPFGQPHPQGPFQVAPVAWLQTEIQARLARVEAEAPLSEQEHNHLWHRLSRIDLKYDGQNLEILQLFRRHRDQALLILDAALLNEDILTRRKALECFPTLTSEVQTVEYKKAEELMVLLLLRSSKDADVEVRRGVTRLLSRIAFEDYRARTAPPELHMHRLLWGHLLETLRKLRTDADPMVRDIAVSALHRIGKGPPLGNGDKF